MEHIERTSSITTLTLGLLIAAVTTAAISMIAHTQLHLVSQTMRVISLILSALALLKVANSVAPALHRIIRTPIHWIHALFFEWLTLIFVIPLLQVLRLHKKYEAPLGSLSGKPILLVHGYCKNSSVWFYLRKQLAKENLGPIYTINLGSRYQSIREYAKAVEKKCAQIRLETGHPELVLIGHSMGGLVSALCAFQSEYITDVITIASPMAGTHLAKIGIGPNAREMKLGSLLTTELTKAISLESRVRFYHIGTKTDHLVVPNRSALPGTHPTREFHFEDIGHASLLLSPRVATLLTHWLKTN